MKIRIEKSFDKDVYKINDKKLLKRVESNEEMSKRVPHLIKKTSHDPKTQGGIQ